MDIEPSTGGVGRVAQELMQQLGHANRVVEQQQRQGITADAKCFDQCLDRARKVRENAEVAKVRQAKIAKSFENTRENLTEAAGPGDGEGRVVRSGVTNFLQRIFKDQDEMEHMMKRALSGETISAFDLVDMQAAVYFYTQELALSTKVIEKARSGMHQTIEVKV